MTQHSNDRLLPSQVYECLRRPDYYYYHHIITNQNQPCVWPYAGIACHQHQQQKAPHCNFMAVANLHTQGARIHDHWHLSPYCCTINHSYKYVGSKLYGWPVMIRPCPPPALTHPDIRRRRRGGGVMALVAKAFPIPRSWVTIILSSFGECKQSEGKCYEGEWPVIWSVMMLVLENIHGCDIKHNTTQISHYHRWRTDTDWVTCELHDLS